MSYSKQYIRRFLFRLLKRNKIIFYVYEWIKWHKEIEYQKKTNSPLNLKSQEIIKREETIIRKYWHIGTFHYYRYGLQYKNLSEEQLLDYVPTYYFHKNIEKHHRGIDTIKFGDKLVQAKLFYERQISTAETLAVIKESCCYEFTSNKIISLWDLIIEQLNCNDNKLFFKPTGNCGGKGIKVLKWINGIYYLDEKPVKTLEDILFNLEKNNVYIIQNKIIQSKQLNDINDSCVNTIRVIVCKENDNMVIKSCILRMGRLGKEVDNSAQGGISIGVDCETGVFSDHAIAEHGADIFYKHPDSGYEFRNQSIEQWHIVKEQIKGIACKLIDFNDIALDIAITNENVKLVEFNFRYGIEHQQCVLGGMRRVLNIPNI